MLLYERSPRQSEDQVGGGSLGLTQQRLSKLQQWILKTTLKKGTDSSEDGIGMYIPRKHLITHWLSENCKARRWGEYGKWKEESDKIRPKFNVSLTRSIKNLHKKELIRTFSISRPDFLLTGELGLAWKTDAQNAKFSRGLKLLQNRTADTSKEDEAIAAYQAVKKARKERRFELKEINVGDRYSNVQAIALTSKGKQLALTLTSPETPKVSNKEQAKT
jgi:hypothetical protein